MKKSKTVRIPDRINAWPSPPKVPDTPSTREDDKGGSVEEPCTLLTQVCGGWINLRLKRRPNGPPPLDRFQRDSRRAFKGGAG
jgi:hypothetical protein